LRENRKIDALFHLFISLKGLLVGALGLLVMFASCGSTGASSLLDAGEVDYSIMSADGRVTLGHGRYSIDREKDSIVLHGESHYSTGEYDLETDVLSPGLTGGLPALQKFDHLFYSAQGTLTRASHADLASGFASCMDTAAQLEQSQALDFPANTWAGASVLIPIQHFLQEGGEEPLAMKVFNCTSQPAIYSVMVSQSSQSSSWPYSGNKVEVNVKPHFGWYDMFIAPFVPKLHAWFDPANGWGFEGVAIARYYKGPQVLLVRSDGKSSGAMQVLVPTAVPTGGASATQSNP
jgi:hypothetical protein